MIHKDNWEETKQRWQAYWKGANTGLPLMNVKARRPEAEAEYQAAVAAGRLFYPEELQPKDMEDLYQDAHRIVQRYRFFCETHQFLGESFPNVSADFGPGSIAAYLGSDIEFRPDTVWFTECVEDWADCPPLVFDDKNPWWKKHYALVRDIAAEAGGDFYCTIPDLMENIDVLASLRGAQNTIFDMMDEPEEVLKRIGQVDDVYFKCYDRFHDLVYNPADGGSAYTVFQIWGQGRTGKIQCDFSAMMSPDQFRTFIQGSLRRQARQLDNVLYHLDGPDAIKHLDAVLEIDEIDALQWTSGDYNPDGTFPEWDVIYDKVRAAGKALWIKVYTGTVEDWMRNVDRIIHKYGSRGTFLLFPDMSRADADRLFEHADKHWRDVPGIFGLK